MESMSVTLDTSHLEMSPLNDEPPWTSSKLLVLVTAETSQDPIGPCGPLEQSVGDSSKHRTMADLRSALDSGAQPVIAVEDYDQGTH